MKNVDRPSLDGAGNSLNDERFGWALRAAIYSGVLTAFGYLAFCVLTGWSDVLGAVTQVGAGGLLVAMSLSLCNYGLRFTRWQAYLRALNHVVPWMPSLRIYVAGFSMTTTPGKAGEMLRGVLLRRWGVPYSDSIAALLSERLSDVLAIVVLALAGLAAHPSARPVFLAGAALVAVGLLVLSRADALFGTAARTSRSTRLRRWLTHVHDLFEGARRCHTPALLSLATVLSILAWAAEAWAFQLILAWMGVDVSFVTAAFIYSISMLAGALTFMPGGLGGAEAAMIGLLLVIDVGNGQAVSATVIIRIATLWFAVALGMLALFANRSAGDSR